MSTQAFRVGQTARLRTLIHSAARPGVLYPCCQRPVVLASKMKVVEASGRPASKKIASETTEYELATEVSEDTEKRKRDVREPARDGLCLARTSIAGIELHITKWLPDYESKQSALFALPLCSL